MKKVFAILFSCVLVFTLAACSVTINTPPVDERSSASASGGESSASSVNQVSSVPGSGSSAVGSTVASSNSISRDEALDIAVAAAGVSKSAIYDVEIELDRDYGVPLYEVEFKSAKVEYKYDVHAETGKILERDKDYND